MRADRAGPPHNCKKVSMAAAGASSNAAVVDKDATAKLLELMSFEADVELAFDQAHHGDKEGLLLAHSQVLAMHSSVIRNALDIEDKNKGRESGKPRRILMRGSLKADFLQVAPFMYPVLPLPKVSWDNLETLLKEGSKWDMPFVLAQAAEYIQFNAIYLDETASSKQFAFKWLKLADAAGVEDAVRVCVGRMQPSMCTEDHLQGLSPGTLRQLVVRMTSVALKAAPDVSPRGCRRCGGQVRCRSCRTTQ